MHKTFEGTGKFKNPLLTREGEKRASVRLNTLETLWFNTGTLCNLECGNCYIESSPTNDRLVYITIDEVRSYLDEIRDLALPTKEIAFTGGEPFMNPHMMAILELCLSRGFDVLVLSNAMKPMAHKQTELLALKDKYTDRLSIRVSIDHYSQDLHEKERGPRSWGPMIAGLMWLSDNGFNFTVAGRSFSHETDDVLRSGYQQLFSAENITLDANDPQQLIIFPEMDEMNDVPEITVDCWGILNVSPDAQMCATSRMIVKHKGDKTPTIMPCTLLPYDRRFDMGSTLTDAKQDVHLNHPFCAQFCVLGGASCSG